MGFFGEGGRRYWRYLRWGLKVGRGWGGFLELFGRKLVGEFGGIFRELRYFRFFCYFYILLLYLRISIFLFPIIIILIIEHIHLFLTNFIIFLCQCFRLLLKLIMILIIFFILLKYQIFFRFLPMKDVIYSWWLVYFMRWFAIYWLFDHFVNFVIFLFW